MRHGLLARVFNTLVLSLLLRIKAVLCVLLPRCGFDHYVYGTLP